MAAARKVYGLYPVKKRDKIYGLQPVKFRGSNYECVRYNNEWDHVYTSVANFIYEMYVIRFMKYAEKE